MRVELLTDRASIEPLENHWRQLAVRRGNPFITPEWFWASLRWLEPREAEPLVAVVRSQGELVAVVPLVVRRSRPMRLGFAGDGVGDVFHPAVTVRAEAAAMSAVWTGLATRIRGAGTIRMRRALIDESTWAPARPAAGLRCDRRLSGVLPYARLPETWEDFLRERSRNFRSEVRRKMRRLEDAFEVRLREASADGTRSADLETLFRLHDARRSVMPGPSGFAGEAVRRFHREFAECSESQGWLRLFTLELDGRPAASWYGWSLGGRRLYYQAGFDPSFSRYSVGLVIQAVAVRDAIAAGEDSFELLLGEESFKSRFATNRRVVEDLAVGGPLAPGRHGFRAERVARAVWGGLPASLRRWRGA